MTERGLAARMLDTARGLQEATNSTQIERMAADLVRGTVPCDEVLHTRVDLARGSSVVRCGPSLFKDEALSRELAPVAHLHPAVLSYLRPCDDGSPRRVSDVALPATWSASPAYEEVFRPRGAHFQLSLVTSLSRSLGIGWVLTNRDRDFTDEDVKSAGLILPLLTAMGALSSSMLDRVESGPPNLTKRESDVLDLLAKGLPAFAIAHRLGISEGTARKHLGHIYSKLNVHDRLSAVLVARSLL